ncbi:MAG: hypothetical protein IIY58_01095 [Aeriscardovia sp.]|nr:hypothetical protein [Aeriscardovia sp.]
MSLVKSYNKERGITYVYESISYWDPLKKVHAAHRTLIGKLDENGKIVPTRHTSRIKLTPEQKQAAWKAKRAALVNATSEEENHDSLDAKNPAPNKGNEPEDANYKQLYEELLESYAELEKQVHLLKQESQRQRDFISGELAKQEEAFDEIRHKASAGIVKGKKLMASLQE